MTLIDSTPKALHRFFQRSPQRPEMRQIALSPVARRLPTAASMPPVPEAVSGSTAFFVQKTYFKSSTTSPRICRNCGERW